jgi:putative glutamine amidotransferase
MRKARYGKILFALVLCGILCSLPIRSQEEHRFFDNASFKSDKVRLVVLYPSLGDLKALEQLRNQELISVENLLVIGLYHEKQLTSFTSSKGFVRKNGHEWIRFHEIKGDLKPDTLFQENSLSEELEKIFSHSDGLILFGGADIPPSVYKEKTSLLTDISTPYRSLLDTMAVFHLLGGWQDENFRPYLESRKEYPILGLCLGCQSLNVGTGGSLHQDISSEIYGKTYVEDVIALGQENWHQNPYANIHPRGFRSSNMHRIAFIGDGKFVRDWGFDRKNRPHVYSSHHQAVKKLGKGIKVIATSLDGKVIEAIEHTVFPNVLGVQFHPEARSLWNSDQKSRLTPDEKEEAPLISILEKNPPGLTFHKKIWSWFSQKLKDSRKRRVQGKT